MVSGWRAAVRADDAAMAIPESAQQLGGGLIDGRVGPRSIPRHRTSGDGTSAADSADCPSARACQTCGTAHEHRVAESENREIGSDRTHIYTHVHGTCL